MNLIFGICWGYIIAVVYHYRLFDSMQMAKDDILETIEDGFAVVDFNGKLIYVNEYANHLHIIKKKQLICFFNMRMNPGRKCF